MLKIMETIHERCNICQKYKKPPLKPIVCVPLSTEFNESIAMDLKMLDGSFILHIIDHATRYSAACYIPTKKREVIISAVLRVWVSTFGPPKRILSDNGKEFSNDDFREMGEKLNTRIVNTSAESPWSNGINERHNAILADMIVKVKQDTGCSLNDAIAWSISAKNALANVHGYSPNQLVFGKNPNFPSVLYDKLPALDKESKSQILVENLNALHSARKAFVSAESSERIRRALRTKTRDVTSCIFQNGDSVYYKREGVPVWKGPGCVIGHEGQTVMVKHGSVYVRVHPSRLMHENTEFQKETKDSDIQENIAPVAKENPLNLSTHDVIIDDDDIIDEQEESNETEAEPEINQEQTVAAESAENDEPDHQATSSSSSEDSSEVLNPGSQIPARKQHVLAKMHNDTWSEYTILSRAGKSKGKYGDWVNVHEKNADKPKSINWKESVVEWKEIVPEEALISYNNSTEAMDAMFRELQKWRDYEVYEEVEESNQKTISVRWVLTEKEGKVKARLVARGFEDKDLDTRTDSPTCSKMNLRLIIAIAASKGWKINALDIQSAYLQGRKVDRDIFLKPPIEANTNKVWRLKKCVYGLNEAARMWYLRVSEELISLGMQKSKFDEAIFCYHSEGKLQGVMSAHVDDFFWAGTNHFKLSIVERLKSTFKISSEQQDSFKYLGIEVSQLNDSICLNQRVYEESLEIISLEGRADRNRALTKNEKDNMRSTVGQLLWIANQTRPDIAFDACHLSNSLRDANVTDISRINKVIRKVQQNRSTLTFKRIRDIEKSTLLTFADASFKGLPGGASQGGFVILLADDEGNVCPIHWRSRKIKRIVKSTLAAECLALQEASDAAYYLKTILT